MKDLQELEREVLARGSYCNLAEVPFDDMLQPLKDYFGAQQEVSVPELSDSLSRMMGYFGDRHSYVRMEEDMRYQGGYLPFATVPYWDSLVVALVPDTAAPYRLFLESYPFLKTINGYPVERLMERANYRHQQAPAATKWSRQAIGLVAIQRVLDRAGVGYTSDSVQLGFESSNLQRDTLVHLPIVPNLTLWKELGGQFDQWRKALEEEQFDLLFRRTESNIGIISLPLMSRLKEGSAFHKTA